MSTDHVIGRTMGEMRFYQGTCHMLETELYQQKRVRVTRKVNQRIRGGFSFAAPDAENFNQLRPDAAMTMRYRPRERLNMHNVFPAPQLNELNEAIFAKAGLYMPRQTRVRKKSPCALRREVLAPIHGSTAVPRSSMRTED
ncbi:predicted protein [Aspergillus nidulans FGSC A4]|uniref:Uncharacterized protein n=1 Tax=Emericella nidulans (strain FGSC A4 / ATCC 38163 / CBS 112.46 / NRRL 194 / M139) TaxID=227321 RepID=Q5BFY5_EMENI|nr:hypothetical protein [Aspergillus nidulans FGSC A4]EAA66644.1 predicted protein [Aspergillus nidulans FGSC A4]CBF89269.1 TPA: conserved hypothetical protein [Aspergillus nidulans FGSC A4]|eukprot:XP_658149.1 predicted protein [Aspergillus nidulans FGSC A4]